MNFSFANKPGDLLTYSASFRANVLGNLVTRNKKADDFRKYQENGANRTRKFWTVNIIRLLPIPKRAV